MSGKRAAVDSYSYLLPRIPRCVISFGVLFTVIGILLQVVGKTSLMMSWSECITFRKHKDNNEMLLKLSNKHLLTFA